MRIALITNYWKNGDGGGVKNHVGNLADALRGKGNETEVLFRKDTYPNIVLIATKEGCYSNELKTCACAIGVEERVVSTCDVEKPFVPLEISDAYTHIMLGDWVPLALLKAMAMANLLLPRRLLVSRRR